MQNYACNLFLKIVKICPMERRRYKRVPLFATARFGKHGEKRVYYGNVVDVSYQGIFIVTNMLLKPGERISVEFNINGSTVTMIGTVARTKVVEHPSLVKYGKGGLGIFIEMMHPTVIDYINSRLMEEFKKPTHPVI